MSHRDFQQLTKFKLLFCDWGGKYIIFLCVFPMNFINANFKRNEKT